MLQCNKHIFSLRHWQRKNAERAFLYGTKQNVSFSVRTLKLKEQVKQVTYHTMVKCLVLLQ